MQGLRWEGPGRTDRGLQTRNPGRSDVMRTVSDQPSAGRWGTGSRERQTELRRLAGSRLRVQVASRGSGRAKKPGGGHTRTQETADEGWGADGGAACRTPPGAQPDAERMGREVRQRRPGFRGRKMKRFWASESAVPLGHQAGGPCPQGLSEPRQPGLPRPRGSGPFSGRGMPEAGP